MKDQFGREITVGCTIVYSGVNSVLSFYEVSKVMPPNHKTSTGVTGKRYHFDRKHNGDFYLAERATALVNDPRRYMIIDKYLLPIERAK